MFVWWWSLEQMQLIPDNKVHLLFLSSSCKFCRNPLCASFPCMYSCKSRSLFDGVFWKDAVDQVIGSGVPQTSKLIINRRFFVQQQGAMIQIDACLVCALATLIGWRCLWVCVQHWEAWHLKQYCKYSVPTRCVAVLIPNQKSIEMRFQFASLKAKRGSVCLPLFFLYTKEIKEAVLQRWLSVAYW